MINQLIEVGSFLKNSYTIVDMNKKDQPLIFVNRTFEKTTQYSCQEVLGKNCRFLQGIGTDPEAAKFIKLCIKNRSAFHIDILNYRKDGSEFWNRLCLLPFKRGEISLYYGMQHEIDAPKSIDKLQPNEMLNGFIKDRVNNFYQTLLLSIEQLKKNSNRDRVRHQIDSAATRISEFVLNL